MEQEKKKSKLKIIIPIAIVILAVVGIVIFASNKGIPGAKEYQIGETVTTSDFEITLKDIQYGESLCGLSQRAEYLQPGDYGTTDNWSSYKSPYIAENGRVLVSISFNLKYTGKKKTSYQPNIVLDYNNGYTFDYKENKPLNNYYSVNVGTNGNYQWNYETRHDFEPLSTNYLEFRTYVDVPKEVMENTQNPLKVIIKLPGKTISYKIR